MVLKRNGSPLKGSASLPLPSAQAPQARGLLDFRATQQKQRGSAIAVILSHKPVNQFTTSALADRARPPALCTRHSGGSLGLQGVLCDAAAPSRSVSNTLWRLVAVFDTSVQ